MGVSRAWAVAALALVVAATGCSRGDGPEPPAVAPGPAEAEAVEFTTADGVQLTGLLFNPAESDGLVVMAHQQGGSADDFIDLAVDFAEHRMSSFLLNFRGYEGQDGEADTNLDVDLAAAVSAMRERGFERIAMLGAGSGATAALHHAESDDLATVVALSPQREFAGIRVRPRQVDETVVFLVDRDRRRDLRHTRFLANRMPDGILLRVRVSGHGIQIVTDADPQSQESMTHMLRNAFGGAFFKLMQARDATESP
jgi:hypothetical protein